MRSFWFLAATVTTLLGFTVQRSLAQTSYPMITHVTPVAVQRGQTAEVTVEGQMNFAGVYKALFEGGGLRAEVVGGPPAKAPAGPPAQVRSVKLKVTADPDAAVGVRECR